MRLAGPGAEAEVARTASARTKSHRTAADLSERWVHEWASRTGLMHTGLAAVTNTAAGRKASRTKGGTDMV